MISLRKPLGSLESPLLSGAGLCDMFAASCCLWEDFSVRIVRFKDSKTRRYSDEFYVPKTNSPVKGLIPDVQVS